ncbi:4Fe-4S ferredoxin iron-sulfur binding domain-containing protein [Desulforamulus hydrothermalis Lam5 = DSM 18033]|uniref:4Fe-4S ferredoxin iron-sulfur binding domain-containing protein n=2 Tax=Desulforamulus TaxID=2916693 RepID=K8E0W9_9FIRM|nr:4Fe-4S ferredoxin iron-sulfur binding domain-containing protein [Desulforamulus hydrothermalis Lam5 = DSM 18033]SHH04688.1 Iron only hydrogenase large subunit, C-terminal domain [Desulforamulus hydrothermalis Lam5 = DSM 18033]
MMALITTDHDNCRKCYACVRACPVKTIAIKNGLPEIVEAGCLGCGQCVLACSIGAKTVRDDTPLLEQWLSEGTRVLAMVAPSYPASFPFSGGMLVAVLRSLGFAGVYEVAYGAGICAREYAKYLGGRIEKPLISTACPAVVQLVEKHFPNLIGNLAPIDSPMLIQAKIMKAVQPEAKIVFIGPCLAKKYESVDSHTAGYIDAVITFRQAERWFNRAQVATERLAELPWDNPQPHLARTFPISGGLLKTAGMYEDIAHMDVVVVEGARRCIEVLRAIESGNFVPRFVDMLVCEGCVMGPGVVSDKPYVVRARQVAATLQQNHHAVSQQELQPVLAGLDFRRKFTAKPVAKATFTEEQVWQTLKETGKHSMRDLINCSACGYDTCWEKAVACLQGMAEKEMCLPFLLRQVPALTSSLMDMSSKLMLSMESINFSTLTLKGTTSKINSRNQQLESLIKETNIIARDTLELANKVLAMISQYSAPQAGQTPVQTPLSASDIEEIRKIAAQSKHQSEKATKAFEDIASVLTQLREDSFMIMEQEKAIKVVTSSLEQIVATYDQLLNIGAAMASIGRNYA